MSAIKSVVSRPGARWLLGGLSVVALLAASSPPAGAAAYLPDTSGGKGGPRYDNNGKGGPGGKGYGGNDGSTGATGTYDAPGAGGGGGAGGGDGGDGASSSTSTGGTGGLGGTSSSHDGQDGGKGSHSGAGIIQASGGGGGGGYNGNGAGATSLNVTGTLSGGNGGNGGDSLSWGSGGGGGAGGYGAIVTGTANSSNSGQISGGNGGAGGDGGAGSDSTGGFGGDGGVGVLFETGGVQFTNNGTIQGGDGGNAGTANLSGLQAGGAGGTGVFFSGTGSQLVNTGTIAGGDAGNGLSSISGKSGYGVTGVNLTVVNSGTISGGQNADAIHFASGSNHLILKQGSVINGKVSADGSADTLELGGTGNDSFNAGQIGSQYTGFESFTKTGTGTWTLTGTNNSNWSVQGGVLKGDSNSLRGNLSNSATITFDQNFDGTYTGTITGTGNLVKSGSGMLTLSGTQSYSGTTTISDGTLAINGQVASDVTINAGARLQGTGTTAAVTALSGATHAPGNSIGTQTVSGNYTLSAGSTLEIEVDNASNADKVDVIGAVSLGGATLRVVGIGSNNFKAANSYTHTIIANDGSDAVNGTFASIDNRLAFYDAAVSYSGDSGNDVVLSLQRNDTDFVDVAATGNQQAVAQRLNNFSSGDAKTLKNALLGLSDQKAQEAFEQLSGDSYGNTPKVTRMLVGQVSRKVSRRLAMLQTRSRNTASSLALAGLPMAEIAGFRDNRYRSSDRTYPASLFAKPDAKPARGSLQPGGMWVQAIGGFGSIDSDGNASATDYDWHGLLTGYDADLTSSLRLGAYFGYASGNNDQTDRQAGIDTDNIMGGLYLTYQPDNWTFNGQIGWTRVNNDSTRHLTFGGIHRTANASYANHAISADIEAARPVTMNTNWSLMPYVGLGATQQFLGSFEESGGGAANLSRDSERVLGGATRTGLRLVGQYELDNGARLIPQFNLGWRHHIGPTQNSTTLRFSNSEPFNVSGSSTDHDTITGNLGLAFIAPNARWSTYADYQPSISQSRVEHAFSAGLRWQF